MVMVHYQLVKEVGETAVGYISNQRIQKECPRHRIQQCLLDLIQLEMFIPDSLLIIPHPGDGQHAIFFLQPPSVELAIRHHPEENGTQSDG